MTVDPYMFPSRARTWLRILLNWASYWGFFLLSPSEKLGHQKKPPTDDKKHNRIDIDKYIPGQSEINRDHSKWIHAKVFISRDT